MPYKNPEDKKRWRNTHKEQDRASNPGWRANHPEKVKEIQKKSDKKHRRKKNNYKFKKKYGITFEQRDALFIKQGSCCASCKTDDPKSKRGWMVDHDHTKKKGDKGFIRGILCHPCNQAANKHHTPTSLRQLADYLEAHS